MSDATEWYEQAVRVTGIEDWAEAGDAYIDSNFGEDLHTYNDIDYEIGYIVTLNSDGPPMSINKIDDDSVTCIWFDNNAVQSAVFFDSQIKFDYDYYWQLDNEVIDDDIVSWHECGGIIWEYKVGSIVKLNSGGPSMSIKKIDGDIITCIWFNNSAIQSADFYEGQICFEYRIEKNCSDKAEAENITSEQNNISVIDSKKDEIPF